MRYITHLVTPEQVTVRVEWCKGTWTRRLNWLEQLLMLFPVGALWKTATIKLWRITFALVTSHERFVF